MKLKSGIIGIALLCLGLNAHAFTSSYTDIAVAGNCFPTEWDVSANLLTLESDYVWSGTVHILTTDGSFKFASNQDWNSVNWGGTFTFLDTPALNVGGLTPSGPDLSFSTIATGEYAVTFYEQTATFDIAPLIPDPNPIAVQLIGSFNGDGSTSVGIMTNTSGYIWATTLELETDSDFLFEVTTADGPENRGALSATDILSMPYIGGNPCSSSRYTLQDILGGTFEFTYDLEANTFTISQTVTNSFLLSTVTAAGNFVAGSPPDVNLDKISSSIWRSDFTVTNTSSFTLSFIGRDAAEGIGRYWNATNAAAMELPASGYMLPSDSTGTTATITAVPGNYRINFDSQSGAFSVQQRYTAASGINYLLNPSFENTTYGVPDDWGLYHATSGEQADFGAHSGARCGVLQAKTIPADPDWGNFDQTTSTISGLSGQTFRVSASFRTRGDWQASTVRIIIEWKEGDTIVDEDAIEVTGLTEHWQTYALEAMVPNDSVQAHILLKYDGEPSTGYLLVDDAEARIAASRFQNFDGWGLIDQFTNISPDWAVSSGMTVLNAADTAPIGGIVISKYIEGSGNNKAIEIFNGTATNQDLGAQGYYLQQYNNGSPSASVSIPLTGTIEKGECLLVSRQNTPVAYAPDPEISDFDNLVTNKYITFNGDDVVVLRKGGPFGSRVDRVGQVGTNAPGSIWSRFATDQTLHRKHTILWGHTNDPTTAFTMDDWVIQPEDDFSELGVHYFSLDDPNAPYVPTGYSLLLNTNASLYTPELDGGIGDISFYIRAQGALAGADIQLAVESSTSQTSTNWTLIETLSIPLTATNFTRYSSFASGSDHTVVRFRHIDDGSTNRIRLDDILVEEAYTVKRSENFAAWTQFLGAPIGSYTIREWSIENAQITTNGRYGNTTATIYPDAGYVSSPHFEGGVGTVNFWISQNRDDLGEIRAEIITSTNEWATWTTNASVGLPASGANVLSTNFSIAIYLPEPSSVRISAQGSPTRFDIDNIEVKLPFLSRTLTFNDFSVSSSYSAYTKDSWNITDTSITTSNLYSGNSARMRNATITSPYMDDIGAISFYYQASTYSGDANARLTVGISPDGSSWTTLDSGIAPSPEVSLYSYLNANTNYHYVRIQQTTSGKRILIDQISIGYPTPIPSCTITADLSPSAPAPNEGFSLVANVVAQNGADVLEVNGLVRLGEFGPWMPLTLTEAGYGHYESSQLPPMSAGAKITSYAWVDYAGIGAKPGSTSYTTNTAYSSTNFVYISAVKKGTVWINEVFYAPYEGEEGGPPWGDTPYNHEYVEICGVAGTSITNWQIELLLLSASDIQANTGAVYATYTVPVSTPVLADTTNGFGFYVVGDYQLMTNGYLVDQALTELVPASVNPYAAADLDHIRDPSGIIRLLDNYGNVVYSLSYGAYDSTSERIPATQSLISNTNSLSLSGTGSVYNAFSWDDEGALTIGGENSGQTLERDTGLPPMGAWHTPDAIAETSLQGTFTQFDPQHAAQYDTLNIHYAFTNSDFTYADIGGTLHHHKQGVAGAWSTAAKQVDFPGNFDTNGTGYAYLRMTVPAYTYSRLDTIEYVIEANPNQAGLATVYLGRDTLGTSSTPYETLEAAQEFPFQYTFPIADIIEIIAYSRPTNTLSQLVTDGNDTEDPINNFQIRYTTNLLIPTEDWGFLPIQANARTNEQNYLDFTNPPGIKNFFAVEPLWP